MPRPSSRSARRGRRKELQEPRASLYDEVTARITAELEAGCFPWVQRWGKVEAQAGMAAA